MAVQIEGFGKDWMVTRRVDGGKPELTTFSSIEDLRRAVRRLLVKNESVRSPRSLPITEPIVEIEPSASDLKLAAEFDCMTCGACCAPLQQDSDVHVQVEDGDLSDLPPRIVKSMVVSKGGDHYLGTKSNAQGKTTCRALSGTIGQQCSCMIYTKRPMACRIFEPGSPECLQARIVFGVQESGSSNQA